MSIRGSNGYFGLSAYRGYLRDLPPAEGVGEAKSNCSCPIAEEIARLIPDLQWVTVEYGEIRYLRHGEKHAHIHPMPRWVRDFIKRIDGQFNLWYPVTAREALAALD